MIIGHIREIVRHPVKSLYEEILEKAKIAVTGYAIEMMILIHIIKTSNS
jgi:hypothetical protein